MASERDIFEISGPLHLTTIDWTDVDHRRSVAACMVQGVYIMQRDRQENRHGPAALAPPWWKFFSFDLHSQLIDDADSSIFGAVFKFKPKSEPSTDYALSTNATPSYIVAFRGTLTKGDAFARDLQLDLHCVKNILHQSSRFKVKHGIRIASSFVTAGLAVAVKAKKNVQQRNIAPDNSFSNLASWVPCLYVNPRDHICSEYIGYFQHRRKMEGIGARGVERLASQHSFSGLLMDAIGKESHEPLHVLPSANLTVNSTPARDLKEAHGIHQWWRCDQQLESRTYRS
ncbi:hypothetical protein HanPI659440_Chr17g0662751 [Helianthus annuus]|nr:hypothetical protein HanPI659440_Chr17g0662751 [Helianthus annuus]